MRRANTIICELNGFLSILMLPSSLSYSLLCIVWKMCCKLLLFRSIFVYPTWISNGVLLLLLMRWIFCHMCRIVPVYQWIFHFICGVYSLALRFLFRCFFSSTQFRRSMFFSVAICVCASVVFSYSCACLIINIQNMDNRSAAVAVVVYVSSFLLIRTGSTIPTFPHQFTAQNINWKP